MSIHSKAKVVQYNVEDDESNVKNGRKGFVRNIFHKNTRTNRKQVYKKMPTADKDDQEGVDLYYFDSEGVPRLKPCVGKSLELFQKAACQRIEVNNEKKPFNEDGLVYTPEQINDIHLSDVFNSHREDFTKYANQRTYAFPDVCQELRVAAIEKGESRLTKIDEITVIDLANLAYVSLFAKKEENKTSALDRFNKLKDQYQNRT
jgi:hypothetical protein